VSVITQYCETIIFTRPLFRKFHNLGTFAEVVGRKYSC